MQIKFLFLYTLIVMHVCCQTEIPQNLSALNLQSWLFIYLFFSVIHFSRSLPAGKCDQSAADGVNAAISF